MNTPKPPGVDAARRKLDQAVREYYTAVSVAWENDNPGMLVGWTLGMALSRFDAEQEEDNLMIESSPGLNNFMARGVADAAAESFQAQASGWGEMEDDDHHG